MTTVAATTSIISHAIKSTIQKQPQQWFVLSSCFAQSSSAKATTITTTISRLVLLGIIGDCVVTTSSNNNNICYCDDGNKNSLWNTLFQKDTKTDTIDWNNVYEKIMNGDGFDIIGKAAGEPVCLFLFFLFFILIF
jgi:hypothetical protein